MQMSKKYYAGLDVSLNKTAVCIVDCDGEIIQEAMVDTEPESIDAYLQAAGLTYEKVGMSPTNWRFGCTGN